MFKNLNEHPLFQKQNQNLFKSESERDLTTSSSAAPLLKPILKKSKEPNLEKLSNQCKATSFSSIAEQSSKSTQSVNFDLKPKIEIKNGYLEPLEKNQELETDSNAHEELFPFPLPNDSSSNDSSDVSFSQDQRYTNEQDLVKFKNKIYRKLL